MHILIHFKFDICSVLYYITVLLQNNCILKESGETKHITLLPIHTLYSLHTIPLTNHTHVYSSYIHFSNLKHTVLTKTHISSSVH